MYTFTDITLYPQKVMAQNIFKKLRNCERSGSLTKFISYHSTFIWLPREASKLAYIDRGEEGAFKPFLPFHFQTPSFHMQACSQSDHYIEISPGPWGTRKQEEQKQPPVKCLTPIYNVVWFSVNCTQEIHFYTP